MFIKAAIFAVLVLIFAGSSLQAQEPLKLKCFLKEGKLHIETSPKDIEAIILSDGGKNYTYLPVPDMSDFMKIQGSGDPAAMQEMFKDSFDLKKIQSDYERGKMPAGAEKIKVPLDTIRKLYDNFGDPAMLEDR